MKFRAVVITKNKLITALLMALAVIFTGIFFVVKTLPDGEDILNSGVLGEQTEKIDVKEVAKNVAGFDISEPQSILDAGIADVNNADLESKDENKGGDMDIYEDFGNNYVMLPTKTDISQADGISMNNATEYEIDVNALCAEDLSFSIDNEGPQVLVVHTHTTECYLGDAMAGESERTTDTEKSVVAVGDVICSTLNEYGIETYHDTTFHDYPSYQGAYNRSMTTVNNLLKQYPSIKVVLDVHRDAFVYSDGTRLTVVDKEADIPTSQVMIVSGTDSMGLYNPKWRENLKFAAKIQNAANIMFPGLMRSINLRTERFNLHLTTGSLILEVGSNGNTLEEAKNAGRNIAIAIASVLAN